jgi:hypothetical protein
MNSIQDAVEKIIEGAKTDEEMLKLVFYFVRDKIPFGFFNKYIYATAEEVLKKRRGICVNKSELLVAMVRAAGMSARFHYSWVSPNCLIDLIHPLLLRNLPDPFLHIYAEVLLRGKWVPMDVLFDQKLYEAILKKGLNFARYPEKRDLIIEFSPTGVISGPVLFEVKDGGYADDLAEVKKIRLTLIQHVLKLFLFPLSNRIIKKVRDT